MSNKEIYKKTLTFSLHRFLFNTCVRPFVLVGVLRNFTQAGADH